MDRKGLSVWPNLLNSQKGKYLICGWHPTLRSSPHASFLISHGESMVSKGEVLFLARSYHLTISFSKCNEHQWLAANQQKFGPNHQ